MSPPGPLTPKLPAQAVIRTEAKGGCWDGAGGALSPRLLLEAWHISPLLCLRPVHAMSCFLILVV